jgi:hypothetical protein
MRKVVCKHCAKDWTIQHSCDSRESESQTVIWIPDPNLEVSLAIAKEALQEIASNTEDKSVIQKVREALKKLK